MRCDCTISKDLVKTCYARKKGRRDRTVPSNYATAIKANRKGRCHVITEKRAASLPANRVFRYFTKREVSSCCSTLFKPVGLHEDCVANLIEGECRYEVVNKETGNECIHPYGIV